MKKIIYLGTPLFSQIILKDLVKHYDVKLVITQPDSIIKKKVVLSKVKEEAILNNIEILQPSKIIDIYEKLKELSSSVDTIITAAYGQFIPSKILNLFKYKINVHGSLLPYGRGGAPIQRSIINGLCKTGITIMEMTKQMDAGRIYMQEEIDILYNDTYKSLNEKMAHLGSKLLIKALPDILNDKNSGTPQDDSKATVLPNLTKEDELIDFNKDANSIYNQIRGLYDNPVAYFTYENIIFKVYDAKVITDDSNLEAGYIISNKNQLIIKCKKDAISILSIKEQGKKQLDIKSYLNGSRVFKIGSICDMIK